MKKLWIVLVCSAVMVFATTQTHPQVGLIGHDYTAQLTSAHTSVRTTDFVTPVRMAWAVGVSLRTTGDKAMAVCGVVTWVGVIGTFSTVWWADDPAVARWTRGFACTSMAGVFGLYATTAIAQSSFCADDYLHFGASSVGTLGIYGALRCCHVEHRPALWWSLGTMAAAGIAKETRDALMPRNHWSWRDLAADAAGISVGAALILGFGK